VLNPLPKPSPELLAHPLLLPWERSQQVWLLNVFLFRVRIRTGQTDRRTRARWDFL